MAEATEEDKRPSRKPNRSDFKQQTLRAWRPVLTPSTVLPTFFAIGAIFAIVGGVLLAENNKVEEIELDYTDCTQTLAINNGESCGNLLGEQGLNYTNTLFPAKQCQCLTPVQSLSGFKGEDTFLYYALDNYFQNHRRYVDSRSDPQLRSKQTEASEECDPIEAPEGNKAFYAPCGLIANSLFNDTIELFRCLDDTCDITSATSAEKVVLSGQDISWKSDRQVKFKNPTSDEDLCDFWVREHGVRPPNWPVDTCKVGSNDTNSCDPTNPTDQNCVYNPWSEEFASNGLAYENEDLIVWMRTAALPNFRKLYRKVVGDLEDGSYRFKIGYNYPVKSFKGKKHIILSTTSSIGGKNPFLGIAYLTVGCLSLVAGFVFLLFMNFDKRDRSTATNFSASNLKWN